MHLAQLGQGLAGTGAPDFQQDFAGLWVARENGPLLLTDAKPSGKVADRVLREARGGAGFAFLFKAVFSVAVWGFFAPVLKNFPRQLVQAVVCQPRHELIVAVNSRQILISE